MDPINLPESEPKENKYTLLDQYNDMLQQEAQEDHEFFTNKYYVSRKHNAGSLFNDDSEFLTYVVVNNQIALDQYIKDQKKRQNVLKKGKINVNYNHEFSNKYVPGKRTAICPKTSCLSRPQMTAAFYQYKKHKLIEKSFLSQIHEENEEFQAYIQTMWRNGNYQRAMDIHPDVQIIIDNYWQTKITEAKSVYPSVYRNINTVPLTLSGEESEQIYLSHVSELQSEGTYHEISQPIRIQDEYHLTTDPKVMSSWLQFIEKNSMPDSESLCLDQDGTVETLAMKNNCQVVMTTSSVKTLLNNLGENHYAASWMLPVHIKLITDPSTGLEKKVIFVDKKLAHKHLTKTEKMFWFGKIAAKKFCYDFSQQIKSNDTKGPKPKNKRTRATDETSDENVDKIENTHSDDTKVNDPSNHKDMTKMNEDLESENINKANEQPKCKDEVIEPPVTPSRVTRSQMKNLKICLNEDPKKSDQETSKTSTTMDQKARESNYDCRGDSSCSDEDSEEDNGLIIDVPCDQEDPEQTDIDTTELKQDSPMRVEEPMFCDKPPNQKIPSSQTNAECKQFSQPKQNQRTRKPLEQIDYSQQENNGRNKKYMLWKLFKEYQQGNELLKNTRHPLNILTNSKEPGNSSPYLCIRAKVEYQCEYGAEMSTLHELLDEWISLYLRPKTDLLRVRVTYDNLEVIMTESHRISDLSHQIQSQYRVNPRHVIGNLYSVLWYLMELPVGQYLLSHEPKSNAFVNVYQADAKGSHFPMAGWQCTEGITRATWRPIDPSVLTPTHEHNRTLPALFTPSDHITTCRRNNKLQKHQSYQKNVADLKKQKKAAISSRKKQRKRAAAEKKKKTSGETLVKLDS
ncbi:hypothetical protein M8J76_010241 [Diaphorina citri]|nr:hypothetical protein M8J76_010241 [Diaphorina citri]